MHFPDTMWQIDTGHEHVPSEEAFLVMLKRLAYSATLATLAWPCERTPYALSRSATALPCSLRLSPLVGLRCPPAPRLSSRRRLDGVCVRTQDLQRSHLPCVRGLWTLTRRTSDTCLPLAVFEGFFSTNGLPLD